MARVWLLLAFVGAAACDARVLQAMGEAQDGLTLLIQAQTGARAVEGRLSRGFPFAEYANPHRAAEVSVGGGEPLLQATAMILEASARHADASASQNLGVLRLIRGKHRLAAQALELAVSLSPDDARARSDLAVAYLEDGIAHDTPRQFALALACTDEAIALDDSLIEPWFNRALALEHLSILPAACDAWHDYLARDEASPWAAYARTRLCALERVDGPAQWSEAQERLDQALVARDGPVVAEIVKVYPIQVRHRGIEVLASQWTGAIRAQDLEAARRALDSAGIIAAALASCQGDRWLVDAVAGCEASGAEPAALVDALGALVEGQRLYGAQAFGPASAALRRAGEGFATVDFAPGALLVDYELARCEIYELRYSDALARLERSQRAADDRGYLQLLGRMRWIAGYIRLIQFDVEPSLQHLEASRRILEAVGDADALATVYLLLAQASSKYGARDDAWHFARLALEANSRLDPARRSHLVYSEIAVIAATDREYAVSRYLFDVAIGAASVRGDAATLGFSLGHRAALLALTGKSDRASADLAEAIRQAESIGDPHLRLRVRGEIAIAEAVVLADTDASTAVEELTRVLETYESTSDRVRIARCHWLRARAYQHLQDDARAQSDLERSLDEILVERHRLSDERLRVGFFDDPETVFKDMIAFQLVRRADPAAAFRYVELARSRALVDGFSREGGRVGGPLDLAGVLERIDDDTALVEYVLLPDSTAIWVLRRGSFDFVRVPRGAAAVGLAVERLRGALADGSVDEVGPLARQLYDWLWKDVEPLLADTTTVVVVPDGPLHVLPFGALVDGVTGRYLVESRAHLKAPSASVFVAATERGLRLADGDEGTALVVGDPAIEETQFRALGRLPGAAREARDVAGFYPGASLIVGEAATKRAIEALAPSASIIHYAGHAASDPSLSAEPMLALARDASDPAGGSEAMTVGEVARLRLARARIVVLAACQTAGGQERAAEGSVSLARAFLAAGAPSVVASHWNVDDAATAELLPDFHRRVVDGESAAAALRGAILRSLESSNASRRSPHAWAAFELFGSDYVQLPRGTRRTR